MRIAIAFCCFVLVVRAAAGVEPPVTAASFTPDGQEVVSVSQRGLQIWSWPALKLQRTKDVDLANVHSLAFSPDGSRLAVGGGHPSEDGIVRVYAWPTLERLASFDGHVDSVRAVVWQTDERLLSASHDHTILLWDPNAAAPVQTLRGHSRSVASLELLDGGRVLVSAGADQSLRVWDMSNAKLVRSLNQHTQPVHDLARRPAVGGLPMVASAADDRTIRFWQPTIGRMVRYVRLDAVPLSLAWLADGSRVLAACGDGQLRVVDPDAVTVTHTLPVLDGWCYAIAAHPTEFAAVVGGTDGQLRRVLIPAN